MRISFAFALLFAAACGTSDPAMVGDDDTPPGPDDLPPAPERGFRIVSPEIEIQPGQEITYCYYFRTPNTEPMAIKKWKSVMTPGSHHMIMYTTRTDTKPEGTVSEQACGFGTSAVDVPLWTYSAGTPENEIALPSDDGTGKPIAQDIAANTPAYFQMHYLNASDAVLKVQVALDAFALEAGATYTKTAPYITYNGSINIPPGATNDVETNTCATPNGSKFWMMSTHAHKQAIHTAVKDGPNVIFESDDWEHPGASMFMDPSSFYTFETGQLTYECTYNNPTTTTIRSGDSAATDEMCMAVGYMFPASKPTFCYDNFIVF